MAQVLPAERDLRRVIGDGDAVPDGEVDGLTEHDLLELYRSLVLLRTYDERSVVYHRQGRIGTYAIFWNHEAMQAGSVYALEDEDWIFPSYRESAIGLLRGMPAATVLSWWRGHPSGWWNPADYNVASICVPIATHVPHAAGLAWGKKLRGEPAVAIAYFGDGATSEGAFHEGANFAAVTRRAARSSSATTTSGRSRRRSPRRRARRRSSTRRSATGSPAIRVDGGDVLAVYEATREAVARARTGGGPTFIEAVSYRAAPHATADDPERVHRPRARRGGAAERVRRPLRAATSSGSGSLIDDRRVDARRGARRRCARGIAEAEAEPPADVSLVFDHAHVDPLPLVRRRAPGVARWLSSRSLEAINDCFHVELGRDAERDGPGRGRRSRRRRLPRDRGAARPVRAGSLLRHAARGGRDHGRRGRALHGRLAARVRDAVRRVLVSVRSTS